MNRKYFLLGLLLSSYFILGLSLLTQPIKATIQYSDNYTWQENLVYENENDNGIEPNYEYNIRNKSYYTQDYPSHFSFENEIGLVNDSISLITQVDVGYYAEVIPSLKNHDSVINMTGNNINSQIHCDFGFSDLENIVEFWYYKNNSVQSSSIIFYDNYKRIIQLYIGYLGSAETLQSYAYLSRTSVITDTTYHYKANNWTHHSIEWYDDDTFSWKVNGRYIVDGVQTYKTQVYGITAINFYVQDISYVCIDALGNNDMIKIPYYTPMDNYIPEIIITNDLEIDKYEFDYNYDSFENNEYDFYSEEPIPLMNTIFMNNIDDITNDITIFQNDMDANYNTKLYYDCNSTSNIINVSFDFKVNSIDDGNYVYFLVDSYDVVNSYGILIAGDMNFYYFSVLTDTWIDTGTDFILDELYSVNMYLNYQDGFGIVYINDVFLISFTLIDDSENVVPYGIDHIELIFTKDSEDTKFTYINFYNYGIYENGTSLKSLDNNDKNYGLLSYNINSENILTLRSNLLDINILQDCSIYNYDDYLDFFDNGNEIYSRGNHSGLDIYNLVNDFTYLYSKLIFVVYNNISYPNYIKSEGLYLDNGIDEFYVNQIYYFHSEKDDNYFYVDNNKLYYTFNNSELDNPEFMSISFNTIDYLVFSNYSIGFNSYITNNYTCRLTINYDDYSTTNYYINKSISEKYSQYNLTEGLYITNLVITVIVDDFDTANGLTDGYIDTIQIGIPYNTFDDFIDDLDDSLLDLEFLEGIVYVMIILIFLIIPCYLVYQRYGKKVVIPMYLLIVIVLMISTFLPIWLSLILLFSGFLFLYHTSKRDDFND